MLDRIDHIGVVVTDLDRSRKFLENLGMELDYAHEIPERNVKVAFYRCGDCRIELVEPTTEEALRRRLGGESTARIEHIGIEVSDISKAIAAAQDIGVAFTSQEPVRIGQNLNIWTEPGTSEGVQYQLVEKGAAQRDTAA